MRVLSEASNALSLDVTSVGLGFDLASVIQILRLVFDLLIVAIAIDIVDLAG